VLVRPGHLRPTTACPSGRPRLADPLGRVRARAERPLAARPGTPPRPAASRPVGMRYGTPGGVGGTPVGWLRCAWPLGSTRGSERSARAGGTGLGRRFVDHRRSALGHSRHRSRAARIAASRWDRAPTGNAATPIRPAPRVPLDVPLAHTARAQEGEAPGGSARRHGPWGRDGGRRHRPACRGRSGDTGPTSISRLCSLRSDDGEFGRPNCPALSRRP
jgi:hypothetical protein